MRSDVRRAPGELVGDKKKILSVDDEMVILIVLGALFRSAGYEVVTSQGGQDAMDRIKAGGYDLMVSDVRMNPISGLEFLKMSKSSHPETPVIMISAYDSADAQRQMRELGAFTFVKKPFDNKELIRLIGMAMAGQPPPPEQNPDDESGS